ncbi:MarR family transcriptional regulator [Lactococcus cremoris]
MTKKKENTSQGFIRYVTLLFWYLRKSKSVTRKQTVEYSRLQGQGQILNILMENSKMTQKNLVAQLDMRPQSASEMIKKLEKKQFISRQKDAQDKRGFIISLTEKGKAVLEESTEQQNLFQALCKLTEEKLNLQINWQTPNELDEKISHEDDRIKEQYNRIAGN